MFCIYCALPWNKQNTLGLNMQTIYCEKAIRHHPRTERIIASFKSTPNIVLCDYYGEVFNPKSQNFRLQKQKPALILAQKTGKRVLPTPEGFGIGSQQNFYFSHMLNCLYDCRYCFLQGMYNSANYVLFVNYEDFMSDIKSTADQHKNAYFFSGYDCDSLAFEPISQFLTEFLPFFEKTPNAILELRTKSANIKSLSQMKPFPNCVVAFSMTPEIIANNVEHKVPPLKKRLQAMKSLAEQGWKIGLRFDPMIWSNDFEVLYQGLIDQVFQHIKADHIHSVSIGPLRFPAKMYQKLVKLYPEDKLLAHPLEKRDNHFSYKKECEIAMKQCITEQLQQHMDKALIFECSPL